MRKKGVIDMRAKSKRAVILMAAAGILSLALTTAVLAAGDYPHQWRRLGMEKRDIAKMLNLSPEQKEQIKKQHEVSRQEWVVLRQKSQEKRMQLKEELNKPVADVDKINALISEMKALAGAQLELRVKAILAMKQILTPEQFKKLQERKDRFEKMGPETHS